MPENGQDGFYNPENLDPELIDQIAQCVQEALPITQLFVLLAPPVSGRPLRYILISHTEGEAPRALGYIPIDYMLEIAIGLTRAVHLTNIANGYRVGVGSPPPANETPETVPFKVL